MIGGHREKGFSQIKDRYYDETLAPTTRLTYIHMLTLRRLESYIRLCNVKGKVGSLPSHQLLRSS